MNDKQIKMAMAYWDQSPNCPAHYTAALNSYYDKRDISNVGMSPRNFQQILDKGLAKATFMGLEPAKIVKTKVKSRLETK